MKSVLLGLLFASVGLTAREPVSVTAWITGPGGHSETIAEVDWADNASAPLTLPPVAKLPDFFHAANPLAVYWICVSVQFDDGYRTPPWRQRIFIEPGTNTTRITYALTDAQGNEVSTGQITDFDGVLESTSEALMMDENGAVTLPGPLAPGPHTLTLRGTTPGCEGDFPLAQSHLIVEPGQAIEALSYRLANWDKKVIDEGEAELDQSPVTLHLAQGDDPGPYSTQLRLESSLWEGAFSQWVHTYVEPDSHRPFMPPAADTAYRLLDAEGQTIAEGTLAPQSGDYNYSLWLPRDLMQSLPLDSSYQLEVSLMSEDGTWFTSQQNQDSALYRQTPYEQWIADYSLSSEELGPQMDPDKDGLSNYLEWYLKTDPSVPQRSVAPKLTPLSEGLAVSWTGRGGIYSPRPGMYEDAATGAPFRIEYLPLILNEADRYWRHGLPMLSSMPAFSYTSETLSGGLERRELVIPYDSYYMGEAILFRWCPAAEL